MAINSHQVIGGIYSIVNTTNGKQYIGSTSNFQKRKVDHLFFLRKGKHHSQYLQSSYNKYGEDNFQFNLLLQCSQEELILIEQYYIDFYKPEYNMSKTAGTTFGTKRSKETKLKMSLAQKEKTISEFTKKKQSEIKVGKPSGARKTVYKICKMSNEILNKYISAKEASILNNMKKTAITNCASGFSKSAGGYIWRYD